MEDSIGHKYGINPVLFLNLFAKKAKKLPHGRRFDGETAEDADEFFHELLLQLDVEERQKRNQTFSDPTDLNRLFCGQIVETVRNADKHDLPIFDADYVLVKMLSVWARKLQRSQHLQVPVGTSLGPPASPR